MVFEPLIFWNQQWTRTTLRTSSNKISILELYIYICSSTRGYRVNIFWPLAKKSQIVSTQVPVPVWYFPKDHHEWQWPLVVSRCNKPESLFQSFMDGITKCVDSFHILVHTRAILCSRFKLFQTTFLRVSKPFFCLDFPRRGSLVWLMRSSGVWISSTISKPRVESW
jgi:hypothetical protein